METRRTRALANGGTPAYEPVARRVPRHAHEATSNRSTARSHQVNSGRYTVAIVP
ncbi:hypothetical protein [Solihabitans fulvus]|uniref:hypothetical protein n=1 Tax=Solihabitans fulvus TaxID=1892852 RepID=UPI001661A25D|nr:hypothetical protein [Solihabitans fulvus]